MMNRIAAIGFAMILPLASSLAAEAEFRIGPRIGPGETRIDAGQVIDTEIVTEAVRQDTLGIGGTFEYRAPFGLVLEGGVSLSGTTDVFDSQEYGLREYFGSVGYQFDLGRGFSIIPRVGRSRWKLESDEQWFFDDPDEDNPTIRGYQNYWEVAAMKRINPRLSMGASYKENHYDFGRVRAAAFTVMFNL